MHNYYKYCREHTHSLRTMYEQLIQVYWYLQQSHVCCYEQQKATATLPSPTSTQPSFFPMSSQLSLTKKKGIKVANEASGYWEKRQTTPPINNEYYEATSKSVKSNVFKYCKKISRQHPHHNYSKFHCTHQCLVELLDDDEIPFTPQKFCYSLFKMLLKESRNVGWKRLQIELVQS